MMAKELPAYQLSVVKEHYGHQESWSVKEVMRRGKDHPTRIRKGLKSNIEPNTSEEDKHRVMKERVYATYFDEEYWRDYLLSTVPAYLADLSAAERERTIVGAWGRQVVYLRLYAVHEGLPPMLFASMLSWSAYNAQRIAGDTPWYLPSDLENRYASQIGQQEQQEMWSQFHITNKEEDEEREVEGKKDDTSKISDDLEDPIEFHAGLILEEIIQQRQRLLIVLPQISSR